MFMPNRPVIMVMRPSATTLAVSTRSTVMSSLRFWSSEVLTRSSVSWMYSSSDCGAAEVHQAVPGPTPWAVHVHGE